MDYWLVSSGTRAEWDAYLETLEVLVDLGHELLRPLLSRG
jgi:hypothetical protein